MGVAGSNPATRPVKLRAHPASSPTPCSSPCCCDGSGGKASAMATAPASKLADCVSANLGETGRQRSQRNGSSLDARPAAGIFRDPQGTEFCRNGPVRRFPSEVEEAEQPLALPAANEGEHIAFGIEEFDRTTRPAPDVRGGRPAPGDSARAPKPGRLPPNRLHGVRCASGTGSQGLP